MTKENKRFKTSETNCKKFLVRSFRRTRMQLFYTINMQRVSARLWIYIENHILGRQLGKWNLARKLFYVLIASVITSTILWTFYIPSDITCILYTFVTLQISDKCIKIHSLVTYYL